MRETGRQKETKRNKEKKNINTLSRILKVEDIVANLWKTIETTILPERIPHAPAPSSSLLPLPPRSMSSLSPLPLSLSSLRSPLLFLSLSPFSYFFQFFSVILHLLILSCSFASSSSPILLPPPFRFFLILLPLLSFPYSPLLLSLLIFSYSLTLSFPFFSLILFLLLPSPHSPLLLSLLIFLSLFFPLLLPLTLHPSPSSSL